MSPYRIFFLVVAAVEVQIEHAIDALDIHGEAFQSIGDLARHRIAIEAADLLEIGELRHLHAVAPHLPAETPGPERRALPIILDEADVVLERVEAYGRERAQIKLLEIRRARLHDDLILIVVLHPVGVLAVPAILRPARGLHIGGVPHLRPERAQRCRRMEGAGAHLHVVGLQDDATLRCPILV